jgi:RNA polymerase sigma factor (TIGR02999 family)
MTHSKPSEITQILDAIGAGDPKAADRLLELVYRELRQIARARMAGERPDQTLQATALVHEAYLRLFGNENLRWESRAHFFNSAAQAMRRILIDRARRRSRLKRGGDRQRVDLDSEVADLEPSPEDLLALDAALTRLEGLDEEMSQVVKLRYFGGLSLEETALALNTSQRTVSRLWTGARAWLHVQLS